MITILVHFSFGYEAGRKGDEIEVSNSSPWGFIRRLLANLSSVSWEFWLGAGI